MIKRNIHTSDWGSFKETSKAIQIIIYDLQILLSIKSCCLQQSQNM